MNASRAVRAAVFSRAEGRCEVCGLTGWAQQHHRRPRGAGGSTAPDTNLPSNLLNACVTCHAEIESRRAWAYRHGYLVHQGHDPATVPVSLWTGVAVLLTPTGGYAAPTPTQETA